ncbi:hypothetical protein [Olleya sp. YS]|uniref:hypothetical protein n=1 Tax=Olleya sp. YS TaxID=3028318 RepID=UPI00243421B9|nr:hypothetical protein [Olleya sp. YS]WGD34542.1 hypothetical protein Ollyesu_12225 [Olleya sp. YS]
MLCLQNATNKYSKTVIVGVLYFYVLSLSAQSFKNDWISNLNFKVEYGLSFPTISGNNSLNISSFPTHIQSETIYNQTSVYNETLTTSNYLGVELFYSLKPRFSIGFASHFRNGFDYASSMVYVQEKYVPANDVLVYNFGTFNQQSKISSTALQVVANYKLLECNLNRSRVTFDTGIGLGLSFIKLRSEINHILLIMRANNSIISQDNTLGPGRLHQETNRFRPFNWQFNVGLNIECNTFFDLKIGYRFTSLGHFTILKRDIKNQNLFIITSTIAGAEDQNLILNTTNSSRKLFSNDIFITVSF